MQNLADRFLRVENNFDFLRLVFASFVVITHSYPVSGQQECDWVCKISNNQASFSHLGVNGFFVLSGYLIWQSMERSKGLLDFFWKRVLRLYPALLVALTLSVLAMSFFYEGAGSYWSNRSTLSYLPKNLSLFSLQFGIEGIFPNNPVRQVINGSLWTLQYEFSMYVLLSGFYFIKKRRQLAGVVLSAVAGLLVLLNVFFFDSIQGHEFIFRVINLGAYFFSGALLSFFKVEQWNAKRNILLLLLLVWGVSTFYGFYFQFCYLFMPLLFLLMGLIPIRYLSSIGKKIGDLSYGIYIYSFPIQQVLVHEYSLSILSLTILSLFLSALLALFSWHFVEKRALRLKKLFGN
jgi:peptidoglycan/LPS O-acetylase OafA/YrhL